MEQHSSRQITVSVVLATFNGERFLGEQLASLLRQTYLPAEIIVCDDCSGDRTSAVIQAAASTARVPIRLFNNTENLGFGLNFLSGVERASGEIVAFCDQDDIWDEDKLAVCVPHFDDKRIVLLAHTARLVNESGIKIGRFTQGIKKDKICEPFASDPWGGYFGFSILFRRELAGVLNHRYFNLELEGTRNKAHDRWISLLAKTGGRTCVLNRDLVSYRQHGSNVYGAPVQSIRVSSRSEMIVRFRNRANSAKRLAELIDKSDGASSLQTYDSAAAAAWWRKIARSYEARAQLYQYGSTAQYIRVWLNKIASGTYNITNDTRYNFREAAKDFYFLFQKKHSEMRQNGPRQ